MLKKSLWSIALCAVGSLGLLLTPATSEARGGGGGHGGGGGGHGGGGFSRGGGGWGGGGWARGGGWGRGYYGGRGYGWGGYGIGVGLGWGGWGYGGYPYDYGYGGYYGTPYYYGSDYYAPGYYGYSAPSTSYDQPTYAVPQAGYYGNLQQPAVQQPTNPNAADFTVVVPDPNAQIWFQDYQTKQQGTVREFESSSLQPGQTYNFHIRAHFMQNGQPVDQVRDVQAKAGQQVRVDFGTPAQK